MRGQNGKTYPVYRNNGGKATILRVSYIFWDEKTETGRERTEYKQFGCRFPLHPSREKGIAERPQAFRYPEILNNDSLKDAQSNAEGIQNRFAQRRLLARTLIRRCAPPSPDWGKAFVLS